MSIFKILDDHFHPDLVKAANAAWPTDEWPGWIDYGDERGGKLASDLAEPIPAACSILLARIALIPTTIWFGPCAPDLSLWGSGLHQMGSGIGLPRHLDADTHPRLGLERVASAVLWVHSKWRPAWGGQLVLEGEAPIDPLPGRLVLFDCRERWHHVSAISCPKGVQRRCLAMFWYAPTPGNAERKHALFDGGDGG